MEGIDIAVIIFMVLLIASSIMLSVEVNRTQGLRSIISDLARKGEEDEKEIERLRKYNWEMLKAIGEDDTIKLGEYKLIYNTYKDNEKATWYGDRESTGNGIFSKLEQHEKEV